MIAQPAQAQGEDRMNYVQMELGIGDWHAGTQITEQQIPDKG